MSLGSDWFLGKRNLLVYRRGRLSKKGMIRAVLGIAFSLLPVILVLEVSSGMIEGITRRYVEVGSFHFQARPYGEVGREDLLNLARRVAARDGILRVTPFVEGQGLVYSAQGRRGVQIRGFDAESYQNDPGMRRYLTILSGAFDFGEDGRGIVLSGVVARQLGVEVGSSVKLLVSRAGGAGGGPILRPGNYTVTGIFTTGYQELDALSLYISLERADRLFRREGALALGIKVDNYIAEVEQKKERLKEALPRDWYLLSWYDLNRYLYRDLSATKTMLLLIMGLIILVAVVNISSTILNLVMERQEQIAVLKSMGALPVHIQRQYVITGFLIGLLGVILGMILGLALAVNVNEAIVLLERSLNGVRRGLVWLFPVLGWDTQDFTLLNPGYYLEEIPLRLPLPEIAAIGFLTLTLSTAAAFFPARKAGRIMPLEALRKH